MKKFTVTIGVSVFNEGKNIRTLLNKILLQKENNFVVKKILVLSDGSTDNTVNEVKKIKNSKINLCAYKKRRGLAYRLNQMFSKANTDYFLKIDGDILPKNNFWLVEIFKYANKGIDLIGGNRQPIDSKKLITNIHNFGDYVWYLIRKDINNGYNIHNHNGTNSAVSRALYKKIKIPTGSIGTDDFIYLHNLKNKGEFRFAKSAIVYYKNPDTFSDYLKQQQRFTGSKEKLTEYFGNWILDIYKIPLIYKIRASIIGFVSNPVMFTLFICVHKYILFRIDRFTYKGPAYGWEITESTKNINLTNQ